MSENEGVVRSSALSFITGQVQAQAHCTLGGTTESEQKSHSQSDVVMPVGLQALCAATARLYPLQTNPLQVTTRLKYWLGGHDPLDYISMYWNQGDVELNIPPHWHYISFGLSDLHGDGRVHPPADRVLCASPTPPPSGYGLELTFRLKASVGSAPPLWPAALLQHLARYIFTTGNKFCAGDHVSWHAALDGGAGAARSRIRHLLVAEDPQLPIVHTPLGTVAFLQMVGCTGRELRAAQRGSGTDVLQCMAKDEQCGGVYLVTEPSRRRSVRALRVSAGARVEDTAPAQLAGVSARVRWLPYDQSECQSRMSQHTLPHALQEEIRCALQRGLSEMANSGGTSTRGNGGSVTHMSVDSASNSVLASADSSAGRRGESGACLSESFEMSSLERALPIDAFASSGFPSGDGPADREDEVVTLRGVHLQLNPEGASLLPLALLGRVTHSRHFTWRDAAGCHAVTLVGERVGGAFVTTRRPYAAKRGWLQVLIPAKAALEMAERAASLAGLADTDSESDSDGEGEGRKGEMEKRKRLPPTAPHSLHWPELNIRLSVMPDHYFY